MIPDNYPQKTKGKIKIIYRMTWYISTHLMTSFFVVLTSILRLAAGRKERAQKWIAEGAVRVVHGILLFPVVLQAQWPDCRGKKKLLSMVRYHEPPTRGWCLQYFQKWIVFRLSATSFDIIQFSVRLGSIHCRLPLTTTGLNAFAAAISRAMLKTPISFGLSFKTELGCYHWTA